MDIGDTMKGYEATAKTRLMRKVPVIVRLDGRAFHTFTAGMERPFDGRFHQCMVGTALALAKDIDGCMLAYGQSDEISLLVTDYGKREAWFGYEVQKMCSVAAGLASAAFFVEYERAFGDRPESLPHFDARVFNLPEDYVLDYFVWRQEDAFKNCVNTTAFWHTVTREGSPTAAHKVLHGLKQNQLQEHLWRSFGINVNDLPVWQKRGFVWRSVPQAPAAQDATKLKRRVQRKLAAGHIDLAQAFANGQRQWMLDRSPPRFSETPDWILQAMEPGKGMEPAEAAVPETP